MTPFVQLQIHVKNLRSSRTADNVVKVNGIWTDHCLNLVMFHSITIKQNRWKFLLKMNQLCQLSNCPTGYWWVIITCCIASIMVHCLDLPTPTKESCWEGRFYCIPSGNWQQKAAGNCKGIVTWSAHDGDTNKCRTRGLPACNTCYHADVIWDHRWQIILQDSRMVISWRLRCGLAWWCISFTCVLHLV